MNSSWEKPSSSAPSATLDVDVQWADDLDDAGDIGDAASIERIIGAALAYLHYQADAEITVRLVNESEMADLNHRFRNKQGATNVLSFPFEQVAGVSLPLLGDVIVCLPVLRREAQQQHKELNQHFAHLLLHGTLHLMGFDHQTEDQALQMEQAERDILQQFGIPDPYGEIAQQ